MPDWITESISSQGIFESSSKIRYDPSSKNPFIMKPNIWNILSIKKDLDNSKKEGEKLKYNIEHLRNVVRENMQTSSQWWASFEYRDLQFRQLNPQKTICAFYFFNFKHHINENWEEMSIFSIPFRNKSKIKICIFLDCCFFIEWMGCGNMKMGQ